MTVKTGWHGQRSVLGIVSGVLALTAIIASGCTHATTSSAQATRDAEIQRPVSETITPLSDQELTALFSNVRLKLPSTLGGPSRAGETFFADGKWSNQVRATETGRFWVANGELCLSRDEVRAPVEPYCRRFGKTAAGDIFLVSAHQGTTQVPINSSLKYEFVKF